MNKIEFRKEGRKEGVEGTVRDFLLSRRGLEIGNDDYLFTSI